uniref:Uncharacterized protein n=1 Tax=Rhizophora mucronata TaxID=61149 RepID=A0A2P2R1L9_RHIMU
MTLDVVKTRPPWNRRHKDSPDLGTQLTPVLFLASIDFRSP